MNHVVSKKKFAIISRIKVIFYPGKIFLPANMDISYSSETNAILTFAIIIVEIKLFLLIHFKPYYLNFRRRDKDLIKSISFAM